MIVLDTSVLIEYYRPSGDSRIRAAVLKAIGEGDIASLFGVA